MSFFSYSEKHLTVRGLVKWLKGLDGSVTCEHVFPARDAKYGGFGMTDARIAAVLKRRGISRPYSHQSTASALAASGRDVAVATPTASGKSLCYNMPVLDSLLKNNGARALYIFPTKALEQDQLAELRGLISELAIKTCVMIYDGDTPTSDRRMAPTCGVVITNPEMLSTGMLPHHGLWCQFFKNLRYIVVDELHTYHGIFGSHMANIFARLLRICAWYGTRPVFICCSATTANPADHAHALTGRTFTVVSESGAPSSEKKFIIYNPKLLNRDTGLRRSSLLDVATIASRALCGGVSTIVFTRSRANVELLLAAIRKRMTANGTDASQISGYRCGYLPEERRRIERGMRCGELRGVVSTNALELGVDIGSLDLAVLHGYPGSVASTLQQAGRVGRRSGLSACVMIASTSPIDQFLAANPSWLLGASPEEARINPANEYIRVNHVRCAAAELPFSEGENFAGADISAILEYDVAHGLLVKEGTPHGTIYRWTGTDNPSSHISMRSADNRTYSIVESGNGKSPRLIGVMDAHSAHRRLYPGAVYLHNGRQWLVERLDIDALRCEVRPAATDYFTECRPSFRIEITRAIESCGICGWGEAIVASSPCMFVKLSRANRAIVGHGTINLPEDRLRTTACWFTIPAKLMPEGETGAALTGFANIVRCVAPLFLMCSRDDIDVFIVMNDTLLRAPAIFVADTQPGGTGLAEGTFHARKKLFAACIDALRNCDCHKGCPACAGYNENTDLKSAALKVVEYFLRNAN